MTDSIRLVDMQIMAEALLAGHMVAWGQRHAGRFPPRCVASLILCLAIAAIPNPSSPDLTRTLLSGSALYLLIFLLLAVALRLCYQVDGWTILFCAVAGYTMQHLLSALNGFLTQAGLWTTLPAPARSFGYLLLLALTYGGCYATLCRGIRRHQRIVVESRRLVAVLFAAVYCDIVVGLVILWYARSDPHQGYLLPLKAYDVLACVFLLVILFSLAANRSLRMENQMMRRLLVEQEKQFTISTQAIEMVNLKCHDLKHQIHALRDGGGAVGADALDDLERTVSLYESTFHTGDKALDVVLGEKQGRCRRDGIELSCMADGAALGFLAPVDVYALFGNALDNAIEAVGRLDPSQGRVIVLQVQAADGTLAIHVENPVGVPPRRNADGTFATTKGNAMDHGYGMRSMELIAKRYGGTLSAGTDDGWFRLDIAIPTP